MVFLFYRGVLDNGMFDLMGRFRRSIRPYTKPIKWMRAIRYPLRLKALIGPYFWLERVFWGTGNTSMLLKGNMGLYADFVALYG